MTVAEPDENDHVSLLHVCAAILKAETWKKLLLLMDSSE